MKQLQKLISVFITLLTIITLTGCVAQKAKPDKSIEPKIKIYTPKNAPEDVKKEMSKLNSPSPNVRIGGVANLADMVPHAVAAVPALIEMLGDYDEWSLYKKRPKLPSGCYPDTYYDCCVPTCFPAGICNHDFFSQPTVSMHAARALAMIGDKRAVEPLIKELKKGNIYGIADALGRLKDPRAVEPLIAIVKAGQWRELELRKSPGTFMRVYNPVEALGLIKDRRAVDTLIGLLNDNKVLISNSAAWSLGEIRDARAVEPIIKAMMPKGLKSSALELSAGTKALTKIGEPALEPLLRLAKHEDPKVRRYSLMALGEVGDTSEFETILGALGDKDKFVRAAAARSLGRVGGRKAVLHLIDALKDDYWLVRGNAAWALGRMGDCCSAEALIELLNDPDSWPREAAAESLFKITGEEFGKDYKKWRKWIEE